MPAMKRFVGNIAEEIMTGVGVSVFQSLTHSVSYYSLAILSASWRPLERGLCACQGGDRANAFNPISKAHWVPQNSSFSQASFIFVSSCPISIGISSKRHIVALVVSRLKLFSVWRPTRKPSKKGMNRVGLSFNDRSRRKWPMRFVYSRLEQLLRRSVSSIAFYPCSSDPYCLHRESSPPSYRATARASPIVFDDRSLRLLKKPSFNRHLKMPPAKTLWQSKPLLANRLNANKHIKLTVT